MKIFLGSSSEQKTLMTEIAEWAEAQGHTPMLWDAPDTFLPGENTNVKLLQISKSVDAAVFLFSEDDKIWYRGDSHLRQPRDNIVLEYGLFCGSLGFRKVAIIKCASPKISTDLDGIVYIHYHESSKYNARVRFNIWMNNIEKEDQDPVLISLQYEQAALKKTIGVLQDDLRFEKTSVSELRAIIERELPVKSGEWILLFERDYYRLFVRVLLENFKNPGEWKEYLENAGLDRIANMIAWDRLNDPDRLRWFLTKTLSTIRTYDRGELFSRMMEQLPVDVVRKIRSDPIVANIQSKEQS